MLNFNEAALTYHEICIYRLQISWYYFQMNIERSRFFNEISNSFDINPVVALLGPRQCGKTTLAKMYADAISTTIQITHLDLENPTDLARLESPMLALDSLRGLIIIDEIQRCPELFQVLRVLVDKHSKTQRYLILGSASRDLISQSSETLAGRISYIELTPFSLLEVNDAQRLITRGGFPKSYLANTDVAGLKWRQDYISTFLERDIPNLGIKIPAQTLRRFWAMLAHYHGNTLNSSEIGNSLGISHNTVRNYLDILSGTFMIRELLPWFENLKKRQVKAPKIYFRDIGIFTALIGLRNLAEIQNHPRLGALWEGFALEEIIRFHAAKSEDCYFWATHNGAELDLLIVNGEQKLGFEFKYTDRPKITKSMQIAIEELKLSNITVIFPGKGDFPLATNIRAIGLESYIDSHIDDNALNRQ